MFIKSPIHSKLDEEILAALAELETLRDAPEKHAAIVDRIAKLHKLKSEERLKPPSTDAVLFTVANIFGILWLTRYERSGEIISSKALSFVMKPR